MGQITHDRTAVSVRSAYAGIVEFVHQHEPVERVVACRAAGRGGSIGGAMQ